MRSLVLALPVSLFLSAAPAGAQTNQYPQTDPEAMTTVQVTAPPATPAFRIWDYQAEAVSGAYALSNGWRLKITPARDGITAQIDRQKPVRLVALSADKFVSRDGNLDMEFNRGADGGDMVMRYVPDSRVAQVIVVTTTLAQR